MHLLEAMKYSIGANGGHDIVGLLGGKGGGGGANDGWYSGRGAVGIHAKDRREALGVLLTLLLLLTLLPLLTLLLLLLFMLPLLLSGAGGSIGGGGSDGGSSGNGGGGVQFGCSSGVPTGPYGLRVKCPTIWVTIGIKKKVSKMTLSVKQHTAM